MCGIAGVVNWGDTTTLKAMADLMTHRGPDDAGVWCKTIASGEWIGLTSRRLSILDLSPAGHMPMCTEDGELTIVYNGECYNYPELRRELEALSYRFRSRSDTEAVLYAYREWGPDCVRRLNGMFAIAVWDEKQQQLFLARDHFGIKPLYYCARKRQLAFASELKSLLVLPDISRELNYDAVHQYLSLLWVPDPLTVIKDIHKLPPGHYAIYRNGELTQREYWDLTFPAECNIPRRDERDLALEVRQRFFATVKSQMLSDVPVGAFLSAGLDSTGIVAAMAEQANGRLNTFTIGFPKEYCKGQVVMDDTSVPKRTAKALGCDHTEIIVEPDVVNLLPKLTYHMDDPMADPSIILSYLVFLEARKKVKVLLSGIGGDEVFAGYRKYRAHYIAQKYRRIPAWLRTGLIEPAVISLPTMRGTALKGYVRLAKKMARSGSLPDRERFLQDSIYMDAGLLSRICTSSFCATRHNFDPLSQHHRYFERVASADFLAQMLYVDMKTFMVSLHLNHFDKTSMACSVETRVPFLDWQFVQWVAHNVPAEMKMKDGISKYIYRKAIKEKVPEEVLKQRKAGFMAPIDFWLANDLRDVLGDILSHDALKRRGIFDPDALWQLIDEHRSGRKDWSFQIWQALILEIWAQRFLDTSFSIADNQAARTSSCPAQA